MNVQLSRQKAPAGGAVVNNRMAGGGQFMERAYRRIRDVASRLAKMSRDHTPLIKEALAKSGPQDRATALGIFADHLEENGLAGAHVFRAHAKRLDKTGSPAIPMERMRRDVDDPESGHTINDYVSPIYHATPDESPARPRIQDAADYKHPGEDYPAAQVHRVRGGVILAVNHRPPGEALFDHAAPRLTAAAPLKSWEDFVHHTQDFPAWLRKRLAQHIRSWRVGWGKPVKLARPPEQTAEYPGSPFAGHEPEGPSLTVRDLRGLEDHYGVAHADRLSPKVRVNADGETFKANKEHVARFLDAIHRRRIQGHPLRKVVQDYKASDREKIAHVALHMGREANEFLDATRANGSADWYGAHVDALEHVLHHVHGIKPGSPEMTVAKGLIAASSSSTNPKDNGLILHRMLEEGKKRDPKNPILGIPAYNEHAMRQWLARFGKSDTRPGHTDVDETTPPLAEARWYKEHVLPRKAELDGPSGDENARVGYRGRPSIMVDRPGHPDHGKLAGWEVSGELYKTPEMVDLLNKHKKSKTSPGYLRRVMLPDTAPDGSLRPKGWNVRGKQVQDGVGYLQKLVRELGAEGARDWLLSPQTDEEFRKRVGFVPKREQIGEDPAAPLPGMFVLGPKFGAFALNLHGNVPGGERHARWLTADKWWSRSWNRILGSLYGGLPNRRRGHVEAPRSPAERQAMSRAAEIATEAAGLRNVAELQAVMWYYEQSLWRMLGVKQAKSYSFLDAAKAILKAAGHGTAKVDVEDGKATFSPGPAGRTGGPPRAGGPDAEPGAAGPGPAGAAAAGGRIAGKLPAAERLKDAVFRAKLRRTLHRLLRAYKLSRPPSLKSV